MSFPIPPLPKEKEGPSAPQLPNVPLPSALQALSGLFLLAQSAPQLLPQATAQMGEQRQEAAQSQMAQFQMQQEQVAKENERMQREFERQMEQLKVQDARDQARLDEAFRMREEDRANKALKLQEEAGKRAERGEKMQKAEFDATAASLLGKWFQDALDRVDATVIDDAERAKLLSSMDPVAMRQFQVQQAKDPKAANALLMAISGKPPLTQTERMRRATELVLSNPGATQLMTAAGLKPEDVFRAEFLPVELPESEDLSALSEISLRRTIVGKITPEEERNFATAVRNLGGTEAINKISDDLARMVEVKYGVDRDQFEQNLSELVATSAGPERIALETPSPPPGEGASGLFKRLLGHTPEERIKQLKKRIASPLLPGRKKAELRAELKRLEDEQTAATKARHAEAAARMR